jgi:regulator of protease activity HflC (stomatin/prohibitin superfamily)
MYFVIAGILILIFVAALVLRLFGNVREGSVVAGLALTFLLVFTAIASATTVDARSVGIQTSFGRYTDTLDNGFHWTAPWSSVEQFSTQIQYLELKNDDAVSVSFAGGSSGSANVVVRWSISEDGAEQLWQRYRTFDNVRDQLVQSEAQNAFRTTFSQYSPVDAIDGNNLNTITSAVRDNLENTLSSYGVNIDSVSVTRVNLGERAQTALDRIVQANADTERAQAEQDRARIDAETAIIRQASLTPEALQRYCLEVVNSWNVDANGPLPATFDCSLGGSTTPVIVGAN